MGWIRVWRSYLAAAPLHIYMGTGVDIGVVTMVLVQMKVKMMAMAVGMIPAMKEL